jgi:HK97 family phage prohead protease
MTIERRYLLTADSPDAITVERRDGEPPVLSGISPPWDSLSVDLGGFREKFSPTAFDGLVDRHQNDPRPKLDVPFLINHDPSLITGRTSNGRLTITKEPRGLGYRHSPIQTSAGRDLVMLVEDRTITGASFAFTVADGGEVWTEDERGGIVRTVTQASGLYDISAVTSPAYPSSSIAPRSLDAWRSARGLVAHRAEGSGLTISLDYDRTFTSAPGLWRSFVADATARGNRVVCISRRDDTDENRQELRIAFGDLEVAQTILCGTDTKKRDAAQAAGVTVDVWIDDYPEGIVTDSQPAAPAAVDGSRSVRISTLAAARAAAAASVARMRIYAG